MDGEERRETKRGAISLDFVITPRVVPTRSPTAGTRGWEKLVLIYSCPDMVTLNRRSSTVQY